MTYQGREVKRAKQSMIYDECEPENIYNVPHLDTVIEKVIIPLR